MHLYKLPLDWHLFTSWHVIRTSFFSCPYRALYLHWSKVATALDSGLLPQDAGLQFECSPRAIVSHLWGSDTGSEGCAPLGQPPERGCSSVSERVSAGSRGSSLQEGFQKEGKNQILSQLDQDPRELLENKTRIRMRIPPAALPLSCNPHGQLVQNQWPF